MTTATRTTTVSLSGAYDLREVALMGFGHRDETSWDGVMRLAMCTDDLLDHVGVEVTQTAAGLDLVVQGGGDLEAIARQVARVVSADRDGVAWEAVCASDPVLRRCHDAAPGFRPANFYSPYEAAVLSVLSARRARAHGITLRRRLSEAHGRVFALEGGTEAALPLPERLLDLDDFPGLPADRIPRLHAIARAAMDGALAVDRLTAMEPADAMVDLQKLPGIGPFYSALIVVRALGLTDVLSTQEDHSRQSVRDLYGLDDEPDDAELERIAEAWRPFRTWAAVTHLAVRDLPCCPRPTVRRSVSVGMVGLDPARGSAGAGAGVRGRGHGGRSVPPPAQRRGPCETDLLKSLSRRRPGRSRRSASYRRERARPRGRRRVGAE